jgi:hypothetical protein
MKAVKRLVVLFTAVGLLAAPAALGDQPGPGEKQCRPGMQNPHCPSSPK